MRIFNDKYGDIYFSHAGGVAEKEFVFLQGNALPTRFLKQPPPENFTIGELGFGTGLAFLLTADLFTKTAHVNAHLHFISVDENPFEKEAMQKLWQAELPDFPYAGLPHTWHNGWQSCTLGAITLHMFKGDISAAFALWPHPVNAWFLDGFAPAKNPAMWAPEVIANIAAYSTPQATFATYTAATSVQQKLENVGFDVHKVKGFGQKRKRLVGILKENPHSLVKESGERPRSVD